MTSKLNVNGSHVHSSDRAALVERALQAVKLSAYEKGNNLQLSTEDLAAAIDLIRAETLDEAARVADATTAFDDNLQKSAGCWTTGQRIAAAIRALKGDT
jgi:hypothetical protein